MTVCDIMTAVRGNQKMLALGEAIKRRLKTGVCVCARTRVCLCSVRVCMCVCVSVLLMH